MLLCGLFKGAVSNSHYIESNGMIIDEEWRKFSWTNFGHYFDIWLEQLRKLETSVRVAGFRAEISIQDLSDTKQLFNKFSGGTTVNFTIL